jgi:GTP-binding protein
MDIRNVAIIAHVDHGKTTLVDGLLKQSKTFRDNEAEMTQDLIMDSFDQERERGITILAKNTAVTYKTTKINIIDTPGHADFAGEVERTLNMADGAVLVIDAQEGPMPQTKFVLKKAFEAGLKIVVVINKIDKKNADIAATIEKTNDLFLDLATTDEQLEFPTLYAIAREGKSWRDFPEDMTGDADLSPIFEAILEFIDKPSCLSDGPLQMLISALDYDSFQGKYAIGKINRGIAKKGLPITLVTDEGIQETSKIDKIFVSQGLKKVEVSEAQAGDIVYLTGLKNVKIGQTLTDANSPEALETIKIEEPTLSMSVGPNTSPFAGKEGKFLTGRQILDRIKKELETNVSLKLNINESGEYIISGRGELHLSVFIETLRREGFELEIGKPQVITKTIDGKLCEPYEELTIDVASEYANSVTGEVGRRKGIMISQDDLGDGTTRLIFEITTAGMLGLRNQILTISRGTGVMNSLFLDFKPVSGSVPRLRNGVLISSETGKAVTYGLSNAQERGTTFVDPQTPVYRGMIVGLHTRENDIEINVTKEKHLTNVRAASSDISIALTPPTKLSLEQCIDFLEDDELLEATPVSLRLRKKILDANLRNRARKN